MVELHQVTTWLLWDRLGVVSPVAMAQDWGPCPDYYGLGHGIIILVTMAQITNHDF